MQAMDRLEFKDESEIKHQLAVSVADDLVRDYEGSVKSLIYTRFFPRHAVLL